MILMVELGKCPSGTSTMRPTHSLLTFGTECPFARSHLPGNACWCHVHRVDAPRPPFPGISPNLSFPAGRAPMGRAPICPAVSADFGAALSRLPQAPYLSASRTRPLESNPLYPIVLPSLRAPCNLEINSAAWRSGGLASLSGRTRHPHLPTSSPSARTRTMHHA